MLSIKKLIITFTLINFTHFSISDTSEPSNKPIEPDQTIDLENQEQDNDKSSPTYTYRTTPIEDTYEYSDNNPDCSLECFYGIFLIGGLISLDRVSSFDIDAGSVQRGEKNFNIKQRELGESLIPFVRFDLSYHLINKSLNGHDFKLEAGYGPLAFNIHKTIYSNKSKKILLELSQIYGSYRMSFGSHVEVDWGMGSLTFNNDSENAHFLMTIPVLFYPTSTYGFEYRPTFSKLVTSHDIATFYKYKYSSIKLGYKWLKVNNNLSNVIYTGGSFSY